jgi:histidine kinase
MDKMKEVVSSFIDNTIKNSGVGMSLETQKKIFEKFSRAENAGKFHASGSGLGLYIAKEFVERQNGRIWAESAGEGKGSTFFVELPRG